MKNIKVALVILLLSVIVFSCANNDPDIKMPENNANAERVLSFDQETFNAERGIWSEQGIPSYSFNLEYNHSNDSHWRGAVAVKGGVLYGFISESDFYSGDEEPDEYALQWIDSFANMYTTVTHEIQRDIFPDTEYPVHTIVEMTYNADYHYPEYYYRSSVITYPQPAFGNGFSEEWHITNFKPNPEIENNVLFFDKETFEQKRQLWQEQNLEEYTFHLSYDSLAPGVPALNIEPGMVNNWSGTIEVYMNRDEQPGGQWCYRISDDAGRYGDFGYWNNTISDIYSRIIFESEKNYGIEWGCISMSTIEIEYDDEYHFPTRYRYHAEPIEPTGDMPRIYEITITNFNPSKGSRY